MHKNATERGEDKAWGEMMKAISRIDPYHRTSQEEIDDTLTTLHGQLSQPEMSDDDKLLAVAAVLGDLLYAHSVRKYVAKPTESAIEPFENMTSIITEDVTEDVKDWQIGAASIPTALTGLDQITGDPDTIDYTVKILKKPSYLGRSQAASGAVTESSTMGQTVATEPEDARGGSSEAAD